MPPEFREKQYEQSIQAAEGQSTSLACQVTGSPRPEVSWEKDGQILSTNSLNGYELSEDGRTLKIREMYKGLSSRFTCMAKNKAGSISRDFFVQTISKVIFLFCFFFILRFFISSLFYFDTSRKSLKATFFLLARPLMQGGERVLLEAVKGSSVLMDCPVASAAAGGFQMEWTKDARNVPVRFFLRITFKSLISILRFF